MAFTQFEYDPVTGVQILADFEDEGQMHFQKWEDLQGLVDLAAMNRAARKDDAMMQKDEYFCLYASVPPTIELEMLKKGISLEKSSMKEIAQEIEANYPYLKHTERKLWRPT